MKEIPNLNELAKEIHNDNKLKGFHDVDWNNEHCLMLAICELCEAIEADRKGMRANLEVFYEWLNDKTIFKQTYSNAFKSNIKDAIEDELADFVIRLLDLAGKKKRQVSDIGNCIEVESLSFTEFSYQLVSLATITALSIGSKISYLIRAVEEYCYVNNIDLWLHVDLKLKYNKTRPYKHGKEY